MRRLYLIPLYTIFVLILTFVFLSCKDQEDDSNSQLNQAIAELEDNPEKAKELLEAMSDTESMSEAEFMQYQLAYIEAKTRTGDDISLDSVILLQLRSYYDKQNDVKRGAYAHFYVGAYYYKQKQYGEAVESYLMADHKAIQSENLILAGKSQNNIGYIFFVQGMADSAIVHLDKALELYNNNQKTEDLQLQTLSSLAATYNLKKDNEGIIKYGQKGLELAKELGNKDRVAFFTQNIGATYCDMGELAQSKEYLFKALPITTNKADSVRLFLNLSRVYSKTNQQDSVSYYADLVAKNVADVTYKPTLKLIYMSLANYNTKIGNHEESMRYMRLLNQVNEEISYEQNAKQLLEANAKFELTLREEALARQKLWMYALVIGSLLLLITIVSLCRHKRQKLKHENELLQKQEKELKLENDLLHQQSVNLGAALNTYEDILRSRKEIIEDMTFEGIETKKLEKIFDKIRQNTNDLFVEWSKSVLKSHPCYEKVMLSISSEELRIMHLSYLEYPCEVIAEMLGFGYDIEDMNYRVRSIKNKLLDAGMKSKEVNAIFMIEMEESNPQMTIP